MGISDKRVIFQSKNGIIIARFMKCGGVIIMAKLTKEEVKHVAHLARLAIYRGRSGKIR